MSCFFSSELLLSEVLFIRISFRLESILICYFIFIFRRDIFFLFRSILDFFSSFLFILDNIHLSEKSFCLDVPPPSPPSL